MPVEYPITVGAFATAAQTGILRWIASVSSGRVDRMHNVAMPYRDRLSREACSAAAEYAVASWLGVPWNPSVTLSRDGTIPVDIPSHNCEVKWTEHRKGRLLIPESGRLNCWYVLVTGDPSNLRIVGRFWHTAETATVYPAERDEFGGAYFWIPQNALTPLGNGR